MKIYTRTGDAGETSLFAGGRASKNALRLHAYGTIDELNSVLGLALAQKLSEPVTAWLNVIQNDLFVVGADLATSVETARTQRVQPAQVTRLEHEIDAMDELLSPLTAFILPGGTAGAATLHIARTVCRRAERWIVAVNDQKSINPNVLQYVNRLSDWLFTAARYENLLADREESTWKKPED